MGTNNSVAYRCVLDECFSTLVAISSVVVVLLPFKEHEVLYKHIATNYNLF